MSIRGFYDFFAASTAGDKLDRPLGGAQTLIDNALRAHIERGQKPTIEETLRRVIREGLQRAT